MTTQQDLDNAKSTYDAAMADYAAAKEALDLAVKQEYRARMAALAARWKVEHAEWLLLHQSHAHAFQDGHFRILRTGLKWVRVEWAQIYDYGHFCAEFTLSRDTGVRRGVRAVRGGAQPSPLIAPDVLQRAIAARFTRGGQ